MCTEINVPSMFIYDHSYPLPLSYYSYTYFRRSEHLEFLACAVLQIYVPRMVATFRRALRLKVYLEYWLLQYKFSNGKLNPLYM